MKEKFMKKALRVLVSVVMLCLLITGMPSVEPVLTAQAAESTITYSAKEGTVSTLSGQNYDVLVDGKYTSPDGTTYCLGFGDGVYVVVEMSEPVLVTGYTLVTGGDTARYTGRNPKSWTLYGCNDAEADRNSASWVQLHSVTDDTVLQAANYGQYTYEVSGQTQAYKYLKIEFSKITSGTVMQLAEFIPLYSACAHDWSITDTRVVTCTVDGYTDYTCSKCNGTKRDIIKAEGHNIGTDGNTCTVCGLTCPHTTYEDGKCTECGTSCSHNTYEGGKCTTCGSYQPAADNNADGVYEIGNAYQLYWFAKYVNAGNKGANAELTADIDFSEWDFSTNPWTPIGQTASFHASGAEVTDTGYSGTFNGNGYTITGLTVTGVSGGIYSYGLFGTVSGTIKNLGMVNFVYTMGNADDTRAGSVAGQLLTGGTITDCYSVGHSITTSNNIAGGIAGCNYGGTVSNCYAYNGTVTGYGERWGGVVGDCKDDGGADAGTVTNCYTDDDRVASIQNASNKITNCSVKEDATFASGEIAYLLNKSTSGGTTWFQTMSGDSADPYPVLNSARGIVYYGYNACKLVYTNDNTGLTEKVGEHSWTDGKCTVCEKKCSHSWTDGKCTVCEKECSHSWTDGKCTVCEKVCTHSWTDGKCTVCEKKCSHSWNGDTCTICGFQYVKDITIKLADGTAFGEGEYTFDDDTKVHTINTTKNVTISGTTTKETIVVAKNVSANITLAGVTIDVSDTKYACALKIEGDGTGTVTITLADKTTNTLESGDYCTGLEMDLESGSENKRHLIIDGTGALTAKGGENGAGIGGSYYAAGGSITINGGTINATGGKYGAGIGGSYYAAGGSITINGGTIEATGGYHGAGIGGGENGAGGSITISGGTITAKGGCDGAGIGGGNNAAGGSITISGGTITAKGDFYGAGIGGGWNGDGESITINGGTITATSGYYGAGIGGGCIGAGGSITISGGSVKAATGTVANAIGGGKGCDAVTPTLKDGTPVYLLEIANESSADIVINSVDYPDAHGNEAKIYAYLPAKTEAEPNGVTVGNAFTGYYYDTTVPEWKKTNSHTHTDTNNDCVCDSCQYAYKHVDANKDSYCDVCGKIADGIGVMAGHSATLSDKISVNFYMELDASVVADETAYMQFTMEGKAPVMVKVNSVGAPVEKYGKNCYVFPYEVAAKEMAATITAQLFCKDGEVSGTAYEYSVKQYADSLISGDIASETQKNVAKAMLDYGAYAQNYFGYNTGALANETYTNGDLTITTEKMNALLNYKPVITDNNADIDYAGSTLILENQIKMRHYFKLAAGAAAPAGLTKYDDTYYYYESAGITIAELGNETTYTGVTDISVKYCPLSYVTTVLRNTNEELTAGEEGLKLKNLMKALYLYYQASQAYNG